MTSVPMTQSSAAQRDGGEADGPFLQVEDLKVTFPTQDGPVTAVQGAPVPWHSLISVSDPPGARRSSMIEDVAAFDT